MKKKMRSESKMKEEKKIRLVFLGLLKKVIEALKSCTQQALMKPSVSRHFLTSEAI